MRAFKFLALIIVSVMVLSACSNTKGKVKSSEVAGFERYSNNATNVSVLTPEGRVGIYAHA